MYINCIFVLELYGYSNMVKCKNYRLNAIVRCKKRFFERKAAKLQSRKEKLKVFVFAFFLFLLIIRYLKLRDFAFTLLKRI